MGLPGFETVTRRFADRFDPEVLAATVEHWAARIDTRPPEGLPCIADVTYGTDPRHRMDLYPVKGRGAPVVLFVHGGGFTGGDKQVSPPFYANVGRYFAAHGMVGACMNYRRAPTGGWPAASQDVEAAAAWLLERCDLYGGDPQRLVVIGQSAGACHVATWLFDRAFEEGVRSRVRAAVLMSGFFEARAPLSPGQAAYFGDDPSLYAGRSPTSHVRQLAHPVLVTQAEWDPPDLRRQSQDMAAALVRSGTPVQTAELASHNHVSPVMSLGSDDDAVGLLLRRFASQSTQAALA
jgi:acetyl esterase/lipase